MYGKGRGQLVSKISNLCAPGPPTLQTDRQTDDMQSQYRALHYSASRGNKNTQTYLRDEVAGFTYKYRSNDSLIYNVTIHGAQSNLRSYSPESHHETGVINRSRERGTLSTWCQTIGARCIRVVTLTLWWRFSDVVASFDATSRAAVNETDWLTLRLK